MFWTGEGKGWGLRTLEDLPKGSFVCEYVGEVLTSSELHERNLRESNDKHSYAVLLDTEWGTRALKEAEILCLDATVYGNVARFINHRYFPSAITWCDGLMSSQLIVLNLFVLLPLIFQ